MSTPESTELTLSTLSRHWRKLRAAIRRDLQKLKSGRSQRKIQICVLGGSFAAIPAAGAGWTYFGTRAISGRPLLHLNFVTNGHKTGNNTSFCCPLRDLA